ncbi:unnamed protein product [Acanthoscelides obtectus]|uniref:G-patch domain-containing protein n=1 Tax=Acanthoscelides obtectus TaxID=200917 RepID=A0A9P0KQD9_ACAOB|nr:unnamed protein product [Acanthoscelides obtectus]CAK1660728.1 PIN2/TERF1-interacting telomerase inhibitor 1 [Acanthoscelides obtectus]
MSMLAEKRRKTKYSLNPRGNQWAQDSNKFGQKILERMGWKHGKGLGAKENGITEHVKVSYKNDSKGMGYKGNDEQWTEHEDKFAALLSSLTGETESKPVAVSSLEKKSQSSKARVHYMKYTRDKGLLKRHTLVHIRRPQVLKTNGVYTLVNETFVENDNTRNVTNKRKEWHVTRNADPKNLITNSSHTVTNSSKSFSLPLFCKDCRQDIDICFKMSETEIPRCMEAPDMNDPTGCGGFCQINTHFCQTLDTKRKVYQCLPLKNILWCPEGFFSCGNMCISERKRCNGLIDCSNKADEEKCACDLETHFHCGNQTSCLELSKKCDKQVDCWDQSDEKGCDQYYSACQENELPCSNGLCIEQQLFCDGQSDCEDGSDEPEGCQT